MRNYTSARQRVLVSLGAALLIFGFASGASARGVRTDAVKSSEIQPGTYDLITTTTPAPIAILKLNGAPYDIKLATAGSQYKVDSGLTQDTAVIAGSDFLKQDPAVLNTNLREIKGPDGSVIGYELTPVYRPLRWGSASDFTDTSYHTSGNTVYAYVSPDDRAYNELMGGG